MNSIKGKLSCNIFIVLLYLLISRDPLENYGVPFIRYADEGIAVLALLIAAWNIQKRRGLLWKRSNNMMIVAVIIIITAGMGGYYRYRYQSLSVTLYDLFTNFKFWLAFYAGGRLFAELDLKSCARRIYQHVTFITVCLFTIFIADIIWKIFPSGYRYGLRYSQLFFQHSTILATTSALLLTILCMLYTYTHKGELLAVLLMVMMAGTLRSKAIAAIFCFLGMYLYLVKFRQKLNVAVVILAVLVVVGITWDQVNYYYVEYRDISARAMLTEGSLRIARDYFPLGAGFGTFGSYQSGVHYSPLYLKYGLSNIHGLGRDARFVSDTFWPMILGQTGFLGLAAYIYMLYWLFRKVQKIRNKDIYQYLSGLFIWAYLLMESTAAAAFVHPVYFSLALVLSVVVREPSLCHIQENISPPNT